MDVMNQLLTPVDSHVQRAATLTAEALAALYAEINKTPAHKRKLAMHQLIKANTRLCVLYTGMDAYLGGNYELACSMLDSLYGVVQCARSYGYEEEAKALAAVTDMWVRAKQFYGVTAKPTEASNEAQTLFS